MKNVIVYTLAGVGIGFLVLYLLFGIVDFLIERNLSCDELIKRNPTMLEQVTYHLPLSKWEECEFAETLEKAPEYDGHTSDDVLTRIQLFL